MKTKLLVYWKRIFTKTFWKAFLGLSAAALLLFFLEYWRYSTFDPGLDAKHCSMCVFTLLGWAFCVSLSVRVLGVGKTLPIVGLTLLFLAMDYINFSEFKVIEDDAPGGGRKMGFYCTYFHAASFTVFFLIVCLFSFSCRSRIVAFFRSFLYYFFFLFSFAVIGNKLFSGRGINEDAMIAILQTDREEAFHYFFGINNGLFLLIWIFLAVLALWWIGRLAFAPFRDRIKRRKLLTTIAAFCCVAALVPCVLMGIKGSMYHFFAPRMFRAMQYPLNYSRDLKLFHENRAEYIHKIQERLSSISTLDCYPGKYVVIVGESLNRNFMSCYGYSKDTTPFQSALKNDDGFYLFRDCYSCHVQTQRVLLLLLTSLNQYNGKGYEISDATSIIDIANLYRYRTAWVSGQEKIAIANSTISALAESSDHIYFSTEKKHERDLDLVHHLDENKILEPDRSLTFVHLNGSHYPYHLSVPPDMTFDEPDLSFYEKSVRFNDMVIEKLFELARANGVDVLLYVSDHSEAVSVRKGHDPRYYLQEMAEIPLWIYLSEDYRKAHPEIADRLRAATGQVFTNDLVFDLLLYLMGMDNEFVDGTLVPGGDDYRIDGENARSVYGRERIVVHAPDSGA